MKPVFAAALGLAAVLWSAASPPASRVLFVGNSYTYFNNLPAIFAALAESSGRRVEVRMTAPGGWRLKDHWEKGEARALLRTAKWDYVVLQDQSTLGVNYFVEGTVHVSTDEVFRPYADKWVSAIRDAGGEPVFYLTWARRSVPEDQAALSAAYIRAARSTRSSLAPVGIAWKDARDRFPDIDLFQKDDSHPSPAGSYLAACVLFSTIFKTHPTGAPERIIGPTVNLETGQVDTARTTVLVDLPPAQARQLQRVAWAAWQRARRSGGYPTMPSVSIPTVAPLREGTTLRNIAGRWQGKLRFYPAGPVDMILSFGESPSSTGRLELKYHRKDFTDESVDLLDLELSDRMITFGMRSTGVDNLRVEFRGVGTSDGRLRGTATTDQIMPNGSPVRLVGTWELARESAPILDLSDRSANNRRYSISLTLVSSSRFIR